MNLPKFIITLDGVLRLGMVNQHKLQSTTPMMIVELLFSDSDSFFKKINVGIKN